MCEIVERSVRLIKPESDERYNTTNLRLSDFKSECGYVLLGEPGIGKSTEFRAEARRVGSGDPVYAREFLFQDPERHPEWRQEPLFIDGLDEVRVGGGDPRFAIDQIAHHLRALGSPSFRLSCRSVNWLDSGDQRVLQSLVGSKEIPILQLNGLNSDNIFKIVSTHQINPDEFIREAHEHNMAFFLRNPQLLNFLLRSVEGDGWPRTPTKMFENVCRELVREHNSEHRDARSPEALPSRKDVLHAGGQLSALMLITNKVGWAVDASESNEVLSSRDLDTDESRLLREALTSRLFKGSLSCRIPIHRLVAEFLGARYLNKKIENGASIRRVLALLMGEDGIPFPDLRGLTAWLAALNPRARGTLIHADPIAVAFHGDASNFSLQERRMLFANLEHSTELAHVWSTESSLGALAGTERLSFIWELSKSTERSESRQTLVYHLLRGIPQTHLEIKVDGASMTGSPPKIDYNHLIKLVYDPSWADDIRCETLRVFDQILADHPRRGAIFRDLLMDVKEGHLLDVRNDLRGTLLHHMYPGELQPMEVWDYLIKGSVPFRYNAYLKFWDQLIDRSSAGQIRELLDSLTNQAQEVISKLASHRKGGTVLKLLAKGLGLFGDELSLPKLYSWFNLVECEVESLQLIPIHYTQEQDDGTDEEATTTIRHWLRKRERVQRALIEHDLIKREAKINQDSRIGLKFIGKDADVEFRFWCIRRALDLWDSHPCASERLAWWSVQDQEGWGQPLSDDKVEEIISCKPVLSEWNQRRLKDREQLQLENAEREERFQKSTEEFRNRHQERIKHIRQQLDKLEEGNCPPALLHYLAQVYFNGFTTKDQDPKSHLVSYLDGNQELAQAALAGFRSLLDRDDLPSLNKIAELHEDRRTSYYMLPFLAAMEEEKEDILNSMSEDQKRRALGFYLVADLPRHYVDPAIHNLINFSHLPKWYENALAKYPEFVADALVLIHNACVRAKISPDQHLFKLAFERKYAPVARHAVKHMFTVFPTRCAGGQLESLRVVLWSAICTRSMSAIELKQIVSKRLNRKNMDLGQRAQWLCAGLIVARDQCLPMLKDFLSVGRESRLYDVVRFLVLDRRRGSILEDVTEWSSQDLGQLIQIFGSRLQRPTFSEEPSFISDQEFSRREYKFLLDRWIHVLAERTDDDTLDALESLITEPKMANWRPEIARAQQDQRRRRQAAQRCDITIEQVQKSLQGGPPASAADLASLTADALEELAVRIRDHSTNDWKQYWDSSQGNPGTPKHENECRDLLLSDLGLRLEKCNFDTIPEPRYSSENRADIRISYGSNFAVPIEIKKNQSTTIWRGISEQLVPKYTRDPKANGYGIYVVLWFGANYMQRVSPLGGLPQDPQELKELLKKNIDPAVRNLIHVIVIDVSSRRA